MGVDTTTAVDHVSTNALDQLPDDLLSTPPAYYAFSQSPSAMEDPLGDGDTATLCIRVKCVGEHGPITRKDGEKRYKRDLAVQAVWKLGEPEPPDAEAEQGPLYPEDPGLLDAEGNVIDHDGEASEGQDGWEYAQPEPNPDGGDE